MARYAVPPRTVRSSLSAYRMTSRGGGSMVVPAIGGVAAAAAMGTPPVKRADQHPRPRTGPRCVERTAAPGAASLPVRALDGGVACTCAAASIRLGDDPHSITYGRNPVVIDFWVMDLNGTPVV